jgi:hypothetical protein
MKSLSKWSIDNFVCTDDGQELATAIQQGFSKAVSNGSFKDQRGMPAFSLFGTTDEPLFIGWNGVPGSIQTQSAYRSELAGIAGIYSPPVSRLRLAPLKSALTDRKHLSNCEEIGHFLQNK